MDFQSLGSTLRQARESRELTLDDAEQTLRIRKHILEAFELGDFEQPALSPVQLNGFIRNYARWLGLDEEQVLDDLDNARHDSLNRRGRRKRATQEVRAVSRGITDTHPTLVSRPSRPSTRQPVSPARATEARERRSGGFLTLLLRLVVAVAALAVIAFVVVQFVTTTPIAVFEPDATRIASSPLPSVPTFTLVPTPTPAAPTANPAAFFSGQGVLVQITMRQRSWIRVEVDGSERFMGIARPGTLMEYAGTSQIAVRAANAEALEIVYNGQRQDIFGARGQRVDLTFSATGVQISSGQQFSEPTLAVSFTPIPTSATDVGALIAALTPSSTPGPSPTASDTPPPTATFTVTFTPSLTFTPSATATPSSTPTASFTPGPSPTATAILPPREPLYTATATKSG